MSSAKVKYKYGFPFHENMSELAIELFAYSITRGQYGRTYCFNKQIDIDEFKFENPTVHLMNFIRMQWDQNVVSLENRGYSNTSLKRAIDRLCNTDDVVFAGAASASKSFAGGLWILADWQAVPHVTSSWVATTTLGASEDRIWGIIAGLHKRAKVPIGKLIDYRHMIVWSTEAYDDNKSNDYKSAIKAIAFPSGGEGQKAVDTTRGRKNDRVRLGIDELPEMQPLCLQTKTNLSANDDAVFFGIGNPSAEDNPHTKWCYPKGCDNFDTVNPEMEEWETQTGLCVYFNGKHSPNMQAPENEPAPFPFLLDRKKIARMLVQNYGDEQAVDFMRNAIGWWPKTGFIQTVLSKAVIREADTLAEPLWDFNDITMLAGFDTSFTSGGDRCVLSIGKQGYIRDRAKKVLYLVGQETLIASGTTKEEFEVAMAKKVVAACVKYGVSPSGFGMDISGDGGRMSHAIMKEWMEIDPSAMSITPISSMGNPSKNIVSSIDPRPCDEVYDRLVTEHWYSAYHGFKTKSVYGLSAESSLARELCLRRYVMKNKKVSIETKDDYKDRQGESPDLADSFCYLIFMGKKHGLQFIVNDKSDKQTMREYFLEKQREERENLHPEEEEDEYAFDDYGED